MGSKRGDEKAVEKKTPGAETEGQDTRQARHRDGAGQPCRPVEAPGARRPSAGCWRR